MDFEEKLEAEIGVAQQEGVDASELWELFEGAGPEQQPVVFRRALEAGALDDEFAFEMLTTIRGNLDQSAPQDRALYGGLLDRFRELDPNLYQKSSHYYHRDLINFAIIEGRWEALPDLLDPYTAGKDLDTFNLVIAQLKYHGQVRALIEVMEKAWPKVKASDEYFEWAIEEYGGTLMELKLADYLERTENPHGDDPELLDATAGLLPWKESWLEWFVSAVSHPDLGAWSQADFAEGDEEKLKRKLSTLQLEFIGSRWQAGVPLTRGWMVWEKWGEFLPAQVKAYKKSTARRKKGRKTKVAPLSRLLIPDAKRMDKILGKSFSIVEGEPYELAATLELIPAYLAHLEDLGLIEASDRERASQQMRPMVANVPNIMASYDGDPVAVDNLMVAWEK
jgi:hypothetical protein